MKKPLAIFIFILVGIICTGCNSDSNVDTYDPEVEVGITARKDNVVKGFEKETKEPDEDEDNEALVYVHAFKQEDVVVEPVIIEYGFEEACEKGTMQKLHGGLPGASEGTWYTIVIEGVEYYYGQYDFQEEVEPSLFGYSIIGDNYSLSNGIHIGMTEDEILGSYPNMAVMDFENNYLYKEVVAHQGWNPVSYPKDWTDQFDYIIIGDIDLENNFDGLPIYLGLLMKDKVVAAITFYNPTAG